MVYILANSNTPSVQFHAASGITGAIVREYSLYQKQDIHHLQAYLIQYNLQHPKLVQWVAKQIYQAIAVISKRGWLEASEEEQDVVYNHIIQLLSMGDHEKKIGLSLAHALIDEFSSRGKASSVGLTWDFHYKTKLSFEERHLRLIFEVALKILHEQLQDVMSIPGQEVSGAQKPLLSLSIMLVETILQWDFASGNTWILTLIKGASIHVLEANPPPGDVLTSDQPVVFFLGQPVLAGTFADDEDDYNRTIVYPASWRSVLVNADVLSMFFTVSLEVLELYLPPLFVCFYLTST